MQGDSNRLDLAGKVATLRAELGQVLRNQERITTVVIQAPTKGDVMSLVKAIEAIEDRQNRHIEATAINARRLILLATSLSGTLAALIKRPGLIDEIIKLLASLGL